MINQPRYLLTGASGFLGQTFNRAFAAANLKVFCVGRSHSDFTWDLSKPFSFEDNLFFDVVIHAAGKAHSIPRNKDEEEEFYNVNFIGTKNLCQALAQLVKKPKAFVFVSTVAVYGVNSGSNINEQCALNGKTAYAQSKILAEGFLEKWCKDQGILLSVIRLPLIAGLNPPGNLGAMIRGIKAGRYLSIGDGCSRKSMVWAQDIANIIPHLVEIGGTYNLTDGVHPTFKDLEEAISEALGKKPPLKIPILVAKIAAGVGDIVGNRFPINSSKLSKITSTLTFDDTKARKLLGWQPSSVTGKLKDTI